MYPSHLKVTTCQSVSSFADLPADVCRSVGDVLARIGDKWSLLVIHMLSGRSKRFSELKRDLGSISQKMLTTTLRGLERDGYVTRTVMPTIPPRVDHELTDMGRDVLVPVTALATWAFMHRGTVEKARAIYDGRD
jgi:DNA-binding HxlR family transcriptional regulator